MSEQSPLGRIATKKRNDTKNVLHRDTRDSLNYRYDLMILAIIMRTHNLRSANNLDKHARFMHKPWFVDFVQQRILARDLVFAFVVVAPGAIL